MKQTTSFAIGLCRTALIGLIITMSYVVTRDTYNYAHWIPHQALRQLGVSYEALLWAETHADNVLHLFGAAILMLLLHGSRIPWLRESAARSLMVIIALCFGAELYQTWNGRGAHWGDLLLGISGGFMAYLAINKNK